MNVLKKINKASGNNVYKTVKRNLQKSMSLIILNEVNNLKK